MSTTLGALQVGVHSNAAGYYNISGFCFETRTKPNIIHRLFVRILLGWKWEARK